MHLRSGDIFIPIRGNDSSVGPGHAQPPLSFYVRVLESRRWERLVVITEVTEVAEELLSHPFAATLPALVHTLRKDTILSGRNMSQDLATIWCAHNFVAARSTLEPFLVARSRRWKRAYLSPLPLTDQPPCSAGGCARCRPHARRPACHLSRSGKKCPRPRVSALVFRAVD